MAIMHMKYKMISRGKGQSAVASASYRSGEKLVDERTGEVKFYHRKVKPETFIMAPEHAPKWVYDRQRLWNEVEKIEKNKNAQLSREILVTLPKELDRQEHLKMLNNYVKEQFVDKGMVADVCIHNDDPTNPHAHIMLTVRPFNERGEWGNKKRKEYLLDEQGNKILDSNSKPKYKTHFVTDWDKKENATKWREAWANETNRALEKNGIEQRVSHLSYEKQGIDKVPTVHLGHVANAMEKKGKRTEKGDYNREAIAYNELKSIIGQLEKEQSQLQRKFRKEVKWENYQQSITPEERKVIDEAASYLKSEVTFKGIDKRMGQLEDWSKRIENNRKFNQWKSNTIQQAKGIYSAIEDYKKQIEIREKWLSEINWMNPLKYKENKQKQQNLEKQIESIKNNIESNNSKLEYHKTKLKFETFEQLQEVEKSFKIQVENDEKTNRCAIRHIVQERDVLEGARNAVQGSYIRFIAEQFPNDPQMAYMDFKTAQNIGSLNKALDRTLSVEVIEQQHAIYKEKVEQYKALESTAKTSNDPALKGFNTMQQQVTQAYSLLESIIQGMKQAQDRFEHERNKRERDERKRKRSRGLER